MGLLERFGSTLAKMQDSTISLLKPWLVIAYSFDGVDSLVDVGGGSGTMAKGIAEAFPDMDCTVFDLPHVVSDLQGSMGTGLAMIIHNEFNYEK